MLLNLFVCVISFSCALLITVPGLKLEPQDKRPMKLKENQSSFESFSYNGVASISLQFE